MTGRLVGMVALALALGACSNSGPGGRTPGEPMAPSARSPTGSVNSTATGGGVPTPLQPGGAGGVGSGNQPGRAGTR
ncbi:hypothetical protein JMJ56_12715 [Belnapia sp. T18]|uniref:Lipoprotein n=1 Tax=Belnapia arida TaxID=2804533 RepID=A0ABS1U2G2_9PROT|nr:MULTISPECIES: hypothetical protein [Belnapia]MBL6078874.1 hypothetical protein [Belnapia arida]